MSRAVPRYHRTNPSLPAVANTECVVVVRVIGKIENQTTMNTFYYFAPVNPPSALQIGTVGTNWQVSFAALYTACISADWTWVQTRVDVVSRNDLSGVSIVNLAGTAGSRAAGHEPTQMGIVIRRGTTVKGQHGRGRFTLPAPASADITNSTVTSGALITALTNLENALINTVSDGVNNWTPCIAQRSPNSPKLVTGRAQINSYLANLVLGTIRRRKIGVGR